MENVNRFHRTCLCLLIVAILTLTPVILSAQIVRDGTVGPGVGTQPTGPDFVIPETMGATSGTNLFHSFSDFNIATNGSATFTGDPALTNVISRVTGTNASTIDGDLISTITGANFWFMNPNGVMFGSGASINVDGAFYVSTGDKLNFNGTTDKFTLTTPSTSLISDAPESFGFLGVPSGTITVNGSNLSSFSGTSSFHDISFTAQEVNIDSAFISPNNGYQITVNANNISITGGSHLRSRTSDTLPGGVTISSLTEAGSIFHMDSSEISSKPNDNFNSGNISITGFDNIEIRRSTVDTTVPGNTDGQAGDIILQANLEILISNCSTFPCALLSATPTFIKSGVFRNGIGGTIDIDTSSLILRGSQISVETSSALTDQLVICDPCDGDDQIGGYSGVAGEIIINADTIELRTSSGESSQIIAATKTAGDAGIVTITAQSLTLFGASQISTASAHPDFIDPTGFGSAGNITITADTVALNGTSGIFSNTFSTGNAGGISINTGNTGSLILDGGTISVNSIGFGATGDIFIFSNYIELMNSSTISSDFNSDLVDPPATPTEDNLVAGSIALRARGASTIKISGDSSISTNTNTPSDAGGILINFFAVDEGNFFETIELINSQITSSTSGEGNSGIIGIDNTNNILLNDGKILASSNGSGSIGQIGILNVVQMDLINSSEILAESLGTATTGNGIILIYAKEVGAGDLNLSGGSSISTNTVSPVKAFGIGLRDFNSITLKDSKITSTSTNTGAAGNISIDLNDGDLGVGGELNMDGGEISVSSAGFGDTGSIDIFVGDFTMSNGSSITSEFNSDLSTMGDPTNSGLVAGTITIRTVVTSNFSMSGNSTISTNTDTPSDAGDILIRNFDSIMVANSSVTSVTTGEGAAGSIDIIQVLAPAIFDVANFVLDGSDISVSSAGFGNSGDINITVGDVTLLNGASITSEFNSALNTLPVDPTAESLVAGNIAIAALTSIFDMSGGSSISTNTDTPSDAGDISINDFEFVSLTDSSITSSSTGTDNPGDAGSIEMLGAIEIDMFNSDIKTEALNDPSGGGNIHIEATDMLYMVDSEISTSVFGGGGGGGDIFIDPIYIILNNSIISANAIFGNGGNITLIADHLFISSDSIISATSQAGVNGTISGDSPESDTTAGTKALKAAYQDSSKLLKKSCSLQTADDNAGSLVVAKSRGLPASPEEMLMAYDPSILDKNSSSYALASAMADADDEKFKPVQVASATALKKGDQAFRGGDYDTAEEELKIASSLLSGTNNKVSRGATLQKLGQTQQALGKYQESLVTLNESLKIADETGERMRQASILSSMGNANIALGKTEEAEKLLQRGMIIAQQTDNPAIVTSSLNNLGNLYTSMGKHDKAMATYRKSADSAKANGQKIVFAKAVSNEARAALLAGDTDRVRELLEGARQWIQTLDDSTEKAFISTLR